MEITSKNYLSLSDVTSVLSDGRLFIAVPGVNAIEYLPNTLRELGITKVYEAFDMDKRELHVATTKHEENVTKVAANIYC